MSNLWREFVSKNGVCGLCGGRGTIDTIGILSSPAGVPCGILAPCICPSSTARSAKLDEDVWLDLHSPPHLLCGLCANFGIVDTRGVLFSVENAACGVRAFCLCPNGREMKRKGADLARWPSSLDYARMRSKVPPEEGEGLGDYRRRVGLSGTETAAARSMRWRSGSWKRDEP